MFDLIISKRKKDSKRYAQCFSDVVETEAHIVDQVVRVLLDNPEADFQFKVSRNPKPRDIVMSIQEIQVELFEELDAEEK